MPANSNQPHPEDFPPPESSVILNELAKTLGGRVGKKNVRLMGGITLTRQLRAIYHEHKIELLANEDLMLVDVGASYGRFELLMINQRPTRSGYIYGGPACKIKTTCTAHTVFTSDGNLSRAQSILYESGALERLLQVIAPHEG